MNSFKQIDFTQFNGLHVWQDTLAFMQDSYSTTIAQIAALIGDNVIVNGVQYNALVGTYSNGWVIINGTPMPFVGGLPSDYVRVETLLQAESFDDGTMKDVGTIKRAIFTPVAVGTIPFTSFKKINDTFINKILKFDKFMSPFLPYDDPANPGTLVRGAWLPWNRPAAEIPIGWEAVPDAELGDWKGRVPVVLDPANPLFDTVGKIGGELEHTLTVSELPEHHHPFDTDGDGALDNNPANGYPLGRQNSDSRRTTYNTADAGGGQPHNNVQPYKVVMFIRFIG